MVIEKHHDLILAEKMEEEGNFEEALQLVNNLEKKDSINDDNRLICFLFKSSLLFNISQFEEAFKYAEQAFQKSKQVELPLYSVDTLILMGKVLVRLQKFDAALEIILQAENLLNDILQLSENQLLQREASIAVIKAYISFYKGDGDNALKYMKKSLALREELGDKKEIIESLCLIGNVYFFYKSDLDLALKAAERCQELVEEVNVKSVRFHLALNLINFGNIYFQKGELDHALKHYEDSIPILEEINDNEFIAGSLSNIANIYLEQNEFERSLDIYKKTLKLHEQIGNPWFISLNFLNIIEILISIDDIQQAKVYLEQFQRFNSQIDNDFTDYCYRFGLAIILKTSHRTHNRAKSEELLKQIVEEKLSSHVNLVSLIHLCDLYLIELSLTNDQEILDDIQPYIDQLLDFAEKNQSYSLLCEVYLLQAKLSLITFDMKKTRRFLIQAHQIARRHDLRRLAEIILNEHEEFIQQLDAWKRLKKINAPISERMELSQLNNQIKRIFRKSLSVSTQISEETVTVHKDKKICLVCKGEVLGFSYICKCNAIYCENCAHALSDLENVCWMCNTPIDQTKPVKTFFRDEEKVKLKTSAKQIKKSEK